MPLSSRRQEAAAEPQAEAWGQAPANPARFASAPPPGFGPIPVNDKNHTNPHGKEPLSDGAYRWTAHHPQVKQLKTKTRETGIHVRQANRGVISRDRVKNCKHCNFVKKSYTTIGNLFCFNHLQRTTTGGRLRRRFEFRKLQ